MAERSVSLAVLLGEAVDHADEYTLPRTLAIAGLVNAVRRWLAQPAQVAAVRELVTSVIVVDAPRTHQNQTGKLVTTETLIHTVILRLVDSAAATPPVEAPEQDTSP